jgi:dTDP-4-amino-4,6-dideoxygalactose transaminase
MRDSFLSFSPPTIGEEEIEEVVHTLRSDWITTGPKVARFEREFVDTVDGPSALAVNSCTAALHLSLLAAGIGEGDGVVTSPMTFCSTVNVIEHVGGRPLLADIRPDTMNVDPETIEELVADNRKMVKAILPVHFAGHPCDMDEIYELARRHDLVVIEDCAHALPARYKGRMIGQLPEDLRSTACYSFYATKNLTTAEGGMLVADQAFVDEARTWSLHGMSRDAWTRYDTEGSWYYEVTRPGFKYNMTDIQAALGLQQLRKLSQFHRRRADIARRYSKAFDQDDALEAPTELAYVDHAWHLYVLRLNLDVLAIDRGRFVAELTERKIGTSVHFIPIHLHPYYRSTYALEPESLQNSLAEFKRIISLPLNTRMTDDDADDVIEAVLDVAKQHRR